jgi:hypothetical protein
MPQRLSDRFRLGDPVEIYISAPAKAGVLEDVGWQPGRVVGRQHPGLWVVAMGTYWFVTNGRHIRPASVHEEE